MGFVFAFVVLSVATRAKALKDYTAFCIGGTIVGVGYTWGPLSGGLLNPAVTLANSLCYKLSIIYKAEPICYIVAQLTGGMLAAIIYRYVIYSNEFADGKVDGYQAM